MYTTIYKPKTIEKFIGNKLAIQSFIKWLLEWEQNENNKRCALIFGHTGIGKNLLVELLLKKFDYNIINLAVDEERSKEYINFHIKPLIKTKKTFDGQENAIVISDIDSGCDYGFISGITECMKETQIPIICICNDKYNQSIKPILNYCFEVKMTKPNYDDVYRLVYDIVIKEKIKIKESQVKELYEESNGDIRFILNSLQLNAISMIGYKKNSKNIQNSNIFETTGNLFSMDETIERKNEIYWLANDLHLLMVQENYINNIIGINNDVKKLENLSYSANALSDADLFDSYINMTNWDFEPYVALNTICATSKCNKKSMMKFPQYLSRISSQNKKKKEKVNYENIKFINNEEKPKIISKTKKTQTVSKKTTSTKSKKTEDKKSK